MRSLLFGCVLLMACGGVGGGDDDDDGIDARTPDAPPPDAPPGPDAPVGDNGGFVTPTVTTTAYDDAGVLVGAADWSCLGTADDTPATTVAFTLTGTVDDFQNPGTEIRNATVEVFPGPDPAAAFDSDGPTQVDGAYTLTLAAGTRYWGFRVVEPGEYLETRELRVVLEPSTASQQHPLRAISRGLAYYLDDGSSLPEDHAQLAATDASGTALLFEITPHGSAFFQAWGGTTTGGPLTLLGEARAPVAGDTFTLVDLTPLRTP